MKNKRTTGALAVAGAYICWGFLTIFWNMLAAVDSMYILAQRIAWSMVFMGIYMILLRRTDEIREVFHNKKSLGICCVCGILVTINWGSYIYAVNSGHVLDASLGYFIEPVLVSAIGMLFFKEQLSCMEKITFCFSVIGLIYMIAATRTIPGMALIIAGSFALYGAVKKTLVITPQASLFLETLCMSPFALAFIIYAEAHGTGSGGVLHSWQFWLLPACGIITSIPLLLFNIGVKKIPYYLSGILMYINPTIQFFMGLLYFHEKLNVHELIAFVIIWIGISFTLWENISFLLHSQRTQATANQLDS